MADDLLKWAAALLSVASCPNCKGDGVSHVDAEGTVCVCVWCEKKAEVSNDVK